MVDLAAGRGLRCAAAAAAQWRRLGGRPGAPLSAGRCCCGVGAPGPCLAAAAWLGGDKTTHQQHATCDACQSSNTKCAPFPTNIRTFDTCMQSAQRCDAAIYTQQNGESRRRQRGGWRDAHEDCSRDRREPPGAGGRWGRAPRSAEWRGPGTRPRSRPTRCALFVRCRLTPITSCMDSRSSHWQSCTVS